MSPFHPLYYLLSFVQQQEKNKNMKVDYLKLCYGKYHSHKNFAFPYLKMYNFVYNSYIPYNVFLSFE